MVWKKRAARAAHRRTGAHPHPKALGSALTHPLITTDYSESQLELITGAHLGVQQCMDELTEVHQFVHRTLKDSGGELLWASSMPCGLPRTRPFRWPAMAAPMWAGQRVCTAWAWATAMGLRMQTISGIHYNWSLPGVSSEQYFSLIRNFRRHAFVLLYLFGASPALCP